MIYALVLALGVAQLGIYILFNNGVLRKLLAFFISILAMLIFFASMFNVGVSSVSQVGFVALNVTLIFILLNMKKILQMRSSVGRTREASARVNLTTNILINICVILLSLETRETLVGDILIFAYFVILASLALNTIISFLAFRIREGSSMHLTDKELPSVSILIPARDETKDLIACLQTVTALDYPKLEVLVLDDCSSNPKTSEIIKSYASKGVRFIQGEPPQDNWVGKNNSYQSLWKEASAEWLFFMGSDVRVNVQTLRNLLQMALGNRYEMISLQPFRDLSSTMAVTSPLRYWWEFTLPRRFIKKPSVISSAWLIKASSLNEFGGFEKVSRSIIPERHIAASLGSKYAYKLAHPRHCWISTTKSLKDQYRTAITHRYAQIRRRMEWQLLATILVVLGLSLIPLAIVEHPRLLIIALVALSMSVFIPAYSHNPSTSIIRAVLALPLLIQELIIMLISMSKYEFGVVRWKGRNVCLPVMRVVPNLPELNAKSKKTKKSKRKSYPRFNERKQAFSNLRSSSGKNKHHKRRHKSRHKRRHKRRHRSRHHHR